MIMVKLESHITVVLEIVAGTFLMYFTVEPPNEGHFSACVCVCVCVCGMCVKERERERHISIFNAFYSGISEQRTLWGQNSTVLSFVESLSSEFFDVWKLYNIIII